MKISKLALAVRYWFEKFEAAERTGFENNVRDELVALRDLLNNQPELVHHGPGLGAPG